MQSTRTVIDNQGQTNQQVRDIQDAEVAESSLRDRQKVSAFLFQSKSAGQFLC